MSKRRLEIDNKLLIFAIQRTTNFEQLLNKNFLGRSVSKPSLPNQQEISDHDWKPFMGMISQCFDAHFEIYANFTDQLVILPFLAHHINIKIYFWSYF